MGHFDLIRELKNDISSPKVLPAVATGTINGVICIIVAVSFGAMIFSGKLSSFGPRAAGLILFGTFCLNLIMVLFSSVKTNISIPQDAPAATLTSAIPAAAALLAISPETAFMTMAGILFLSSLTTGLAFWLIGRFRLTNLFRFIPYPVIGGFLAGSGWLLCTGGISVMCGISPGFSTLSPMFEVQPFLQWFPAVLFAFGLFVTMLKRSHYLILPLSLIAAGLLYYLVFAVCSISIPQAREMGFLVSGIPEKGLFPAFTLQSLTAVHWSTVLGNIPLALTVSLVTILCMLLNMTGIELSCEDDISMNKEFKITGLANMAAALGGSSPGNVALSLTMLGIKTGATTRLAGLVSIALIGLTLFFGGGLVMLFPRPLLGALLFLLGLFFLWEWLVDSFKRMPVMDYVLILLITGVIVSFGFLEGVAAGIGATILIFVVRFSRISAVRTSNTLRNCRSCRIRPIPDQFILQSQGENAPVLELSGYLFFGSATTLVESLLKTIAGRPISILLDFSQVTGFDVSAVNNFQRLLQAVEKNNVRTFFTGCPKSFVDAIQSSCESDILPRFHSSLNEGLEQNEDLLIEQNLERIAAGADRERDALFDLSSDAIMVQLERLEQFEHLVEGLKTALENDASDGVIRTFQESETIIEPDRPAAATLLILSGTAREVTVQGERHRTHGVGDILCPAAQIRATVPEQTFIAETQVQAICITQDLRNRLETGRLELVIELDRYILYKFS